MSKTFKNKMEDVYIPDQKEETSCRNDIIQIYEKNIEINKDPMDLIQLASIYQELNDFHNIERIINFSIEIKSLKLMNDFAKYFYKIKNFEKMESCLLKACEFGSKIAKDNLDAFCSSKFAQKPFIFRELCLD